MTLTTFPLYESPIGPRRRLPQVQAASVSANSGCEVVSTVLRSVWSRAQGGGGVMPAEKSDKSELSRFITLHK